MHSVQCTKHTLCTAIPSQSSQGPLYTVHSSLVQPLVQGSPALGDQGLPLPPQGRQVVRCTDLDSVRTQWTVDSQDPVDSGQSGPSGQCQDTVNPPGHLQAPVVLHGLPGLALQQLDASYTQQGVLGSWTQNQHLEQQGAVVQVCRCVLPSQRPSWLQCSCPWPCRRLPGPPRRAGRRGRSAGRPAGRTLPGGGDSQAVKCV